MKKRIIVSGESIALSYQLMKDGEPVNIEDYTFKFGVKAHAGDTEYILGPIDGIIETAAEGKVGFPLTATDTDLDACSGMYEIAMYDGDNKKRVLTPPGGVAFIVLEGIIE